jgi:predicted RNA methylase
MAKKYKNYLMVMNIEATKDTIIAIQDMITEAIAHENIKCDDKENVSIVTSANNTTKINAENNSIIITQI